MYLKRKIPSALFFITILSVLSCSDNHLPVRHTMIRCNVGDYTFVLGDNATNVLEDWPGLTEAYSMQGYNDSVAIYSETYEEHMFAFSFYKGKLFETDFTIPQSELSGSTIMVDGKVIPFDKSFKKDMEVTGINYAVVTEPNDFDGMKSVNVTISYTDANKYLKRAE